VTDLTQALNMTRSAVSHQLKVLKTSRLIKSRRDGKQILYSLDDEHVECILLTGMAHIKEEF
jgi:ArsR family transcriptional regulator